jgi:hypothetical protein
MKYNAIMLHPRTWRILEDCVDRGITLGIRKAYKYNPDPTEVEFSQQISHHIMLEISEYFDVGTPQPKELPDGDARE